MRQGRRSLQGRQAVSGWIAAALLALAAGTAAAADFAPPRSATARAPVAVTAAQTPQRIAVRRVGARPTNEKIGITAQGLFCGNESDARFTDSLARVVLNGFPVLVRRELTAAGYPDVPESLFGAQSSEAEAAEYDLGAALTNVELRLCGTVNSSEGGIWIQLRWELYSPRERRVVFSTATEGSAQAGSQAKKPLIDLARDAVAMATRNLLADPGFVENATRKAQGKPAADQPLLPIAQRAAGTQPVGDQMTLLQSAVATIYSGAGSGSGFYIHRDGWLLTNQHVVGDARFVKVKLANGRELVGEVMRSAAARDVALVKTEAVALAPFEIAGGEGQAGDDVWVLGSPLGDKLAYTVTRGVLSATREVEQQRWLQSDVRVLPGSSGGPMVGRTGAVLGIVSRGLGGGGAGVNFFVPIGDALAALRIEFQPPR